MATQRRKFRRPLGELPYRKLFIIAVEGAKTEHLYFGIFDDDTSIVQVNCLKGKNKSSPPQVLKRMTDRLGSEELKSSDEAWLVVDKDNWTENQLSQLHQWSSQKANYGFALSNPNFEYWLLLHFEDGKGISSSRDCKDRLKRMIVDYDKSFDARKITQGQIDNAILRARTRDHPPCKDWPRDIGQTTVYRLVDNILKARIEQVM